MSGRAKGKLFVIRGKERLDVGLQEDEFLLQAVFYCMAGPNPACRLSMLALPRWQNLTPPLDHANRPARIPPGSRPCWRLSAGNALCHRWVTPTGRPESRLPTVHVGAPSPSKPYATVWPRQQAAPNPACRLSMLALPRWQNLTPPLDHANRPPRIPPGSRPCWRLSAGKTLSHRRTTLTGRPESRLPGAHVGASPPAKPYLTVGPRQQAGPNPACLPSMLAPPRRQNLMPPSGHANRPARIPPAGRPCWRLPAGKTLSYRRATPTGRPESCPEADHVGASPLAKPYPTAGPRQQAGPNPACRPSMLAPLRRQNLMPPSGHANSPVQIQPAGRPCWRLPAGKTLCHRRATPTGRPKSRLPAAHVGVVRLRRNSFLYGNL